MRCNCTGWTWRQSDYNRSAPAFPWMERHPDREIGTELVGSLTKWFPIRGIRNTATTGEFHPFFLPQSLRLDRPRRLFAPFTTGQVTPAGLLTR